MKRPIRWLAAAYLAVLALWLILGGVSLGKNAWYAHKGMKAQTELAWQDLTGVGVQELEGQREGVWYVSTETVCTADDLRLFLLDKRYTHILIDESDDYIAGTIGPAFDIEDLPDRRTDSVILLRVEYEGDTVRWVYEEGGAA